MGCWEQWRWVCGRLGANVRGVGMGVGPVLEERRGLGVCVENWTAVGWVGVNF